MNTELYVLDSLLDVLCVAKVRDDHACGLMRRGWIKHNEWIIEGRTVLEISHDHFIEFLQEAGV